MGWCGVGFRRYDALRAMLRRHPLQFPLREGEEELVGGFYLHGYDVDAVVFLVADGCGVVAEETE